MRVGDMFAGLGGFSAGARSAGAEIVWAANHWPEAVDWHKKNHPETHHECQDLRQANFHAFPDIDLLLASPACQGHSKARGKDRAHHDETRATAWAVVDACEAKRPKVMTLENVPEFLDWALYPARELAMHKLGYALKAHILDAADFGAPQHRLRLFLTAVLGKEPFEIMTPYVDHKPVGDVIDWNWPRWSKIDKPGRSKATLERAEAGRREFGDRFVMPYYGSGSGKKGRSLDRPLGTVTTRDRWALVDGDRMRMLQVPEYRDCMTFEEDYLLPDVRKTAIHLLGNAVCPVVSEEITRQVLARA